MAVCGILTVNIPCFSALAHRFNGHGLRSWLYSITLLRYYRCNTLSPVGNSDVRLAAEDTDVNVYIQEGRDHLAV